ncbi:SMP-30/gluconolactonase/LRE family protein [Sporosarcina sp. 6E9]|uniref:SMP-30/gluconolactonase/LRE family protein n=1 Tax=Sporosarcina sp. 6E9 TaxID=2819235 RepID=UPI001B308614|nr:SMP-30/gluconolactonase/LRE family protein [Sporosarcina sp. 6E9]
MIYHAELVLNEQAILAEGPCWDYEKNLLYWVDILGKKVNVFNPVTEINLSIDVGQLIGAAAIREKGGLVVALQNGFHFLNLDNGQLIKIDDPESNMESNRFNDGKCDPAGRFWAGTMSLEAVQNEGSLYCLDTNHLVEKVIADVTISNGLAWDTSKNKMYFIDTPLNKVFVFDYEIETGAISNRKVAVNISKDLGAPDGMTIDREGMLWIALWGGSKVIRCNPKTGQIIGEVLVPCSKVTSCTFGGKDLDELYITTARLNPSEKELKEEPLAGGIFKAKVGVKGNKEFFYKG